jgi:GxxExxY protein
MNENRIGDIIVDRAVKLHMATGPGLFESVYEAFLEKQLQADGFLVERQVVIPIQFNDVHLKEGFRADLVVEKKVIIELKSVETLHAAHKKQLLTYLKLSNIKLGYLLNFGAPRMKDGITRMINGHIL